MLGLRSLLSACFLGFIAVIGVTGCGQGAGTTPAASIDGTTPEGASTATLVAETNNTTATTPATAPRKPTEAELHPEVVIKTSLGDIRVKLDAEKAPLTVDNFLENYVRRQFYSDTLIHYVASDSMIAAGGFTPKYEPKAVRAPIANEAKNGLSNKRGTLAMARDPQYAQSATSQFFINLADTPDLDHKNTDTSEDYGYCVFGEVIAGMEVVDAIAKVKVHDQGDFVSTPVEPVVILSVEEVAK
ncbi:MAG TPA: peptidylprolyl isomerase [Pirellulaceae bacterium]|nr:peptidylprolyl isomerase [Pirellulaceae bacterium]